jgi:SAM-dependent methyltransferase
MDAANRPLEDLADAAEAHARREHGLALEDPAQADRILRAEAGRPDAGRFEFLSACYGAWLGRWARRRWQGRWVGLSEPVPPRLRVGGVAVSPMDAVARRLRDPSAPSLPELLEPLEGWAREAAARAEAASANRAAWDALADDPRFAGPAPFPDDPDSGLDEWVRAEGVRGKRVLCLGAGGGRQGPLHARAGADVTVVDVSERQLGHDRRAAAELGLSLRAVCASIDALGALEAASFDIAVQPVSACYVPDVRRVYAEVARVVRPGGLYVVQHKQPAGLQAGAGPGYALEHPADEGRLLPPAPPGAFHREAGTAEFLHPLGALLGGLCRAGFVIEDVEEPPRADAWAPPGSPGHRARYLPPYLKVKARRAR